MCVLSSENTMAVYCRVMGSVVIVIFVVKIVIWPLLVGAGIGTLCAISFFKALFFCCYSRLDWLNKTHMMNILVTASVDGPNNDDAGVFLPPSGFA
jgi:hypothetical protein